MREFRPHCGTGSDFRRRAPPAPRRARAGVPPGSACVKSARSIAAEVRSGRRSARSIIAQTLADIHQNNPAINAFTARLDDQAERDAAAIDAAVDSGRDPGPLAGVPFAVKNLFDIAGVTTLAGARIYARSEEHTSELQ